MTELLLNTVELQADLLIQTDTFLPVLVNSTPNFLYINLYILRSGPDPKNIEEWRNTSTLCGEERVEKP